MRRSTTALVLFACTLLLSAACDESADTPGTATPAVGSLASGMSTGTEPSTPGIATAVVSATPPSSPPSESATFGDPIVIKRTMLVAVIGTGGEQPPSQIERVRLNSDGVLEREVVLDPTALDYPGAYINTWRNIHHPPATGGGTTVSICYAGTCGGLGAASKDAKTVLMQSSDGGDSWQELADLDGAYWVVSRPAADNANALLYEYPVEGQPGRFVRWPSMATVEPPDPERGSGFRKETWPLMLPDGRVAWWWTDRRLVDESRHTVLDISRLSEFGERPVELLASPDGERIVVTWEGGEAGTWHWTLFERAGGDAYDAVRTLAQPAGLFLAVPYTWLSDHEVIVPASATPEQLGMTWASHVGYVPAVVDFRTGQIHAVVGFDDPEVAGRGNLVVGVE